MTLAVEGAGGAMAELRKAEAEHALDACRGYEYWAREVTRLTGEIGECECHKENEGQEDFGPLTPSCFGAAAAEVWDGAHADDGPQRRDLDGIEKAVEGCASCTRLCRLIRERKYARQR